jgi:hypothetical protein
MNTLLYVANRVVEGVLSLEGGKTVEADNQSIYVKDGRNYLDDYYLDSERLGPDKYDFELEHAVFTVEEVQAYIDGDYKADYKAYQKARQEAVARIAELIAQVSPAMEELLTLANEFNIPANIQVGRYTNDFRLIDAVDWDSSSMYC